LGGIPGIYSETGAVLVGSQTNTIFLNGKVGINIGWTTAPDANASLDVGAGGIKVQGVTIQGESGRNFFSDSEMKGRLRVGAWGGIPGIYSETGAVLVGSQANIIYLNGQVGINIDRATAPDAKASLDVGGGIKAKSISFGEENLRIILGIIMGRPADKIWGKGFSLQAKGTEGLWQINFNPNFAADPTVIVSPTRGNTWAICNQMEKDFCTVKTGAGGTDSDHGFSFIVIGPA
jgi:hypothetical protein